MSEALVKTSACVKSGFGLHVGPGITLAVVNSSRDAASGVFWYWGWLHSDTRDPLFNSSSQNVTSVVPRKVADGGPGIQ